jgi:hypothetical protein
MLEASCQAVPNDWQLYGVLGKDERGGKMAAAS